MPINSLPPEILTHIFFLVINSQPCEVENRRRDELKFPLYPELLSHVNSHWRHIALDAPNLWTLIDLILVRTQGHLSSRAQTMIKRASSLPLEIHIARPDGHQINYYHGLLTALGSIAPRINTLSLEIEASPLDTELATGARDTHLFEACFSKCIPGTLTKLTLVARSKSYVTLSSRSDPSRSGRQLSTRTQALNAILVPIKYLRLEGIHFAWTNSMYRGLTDLYLTSRYWRPIINDIELVGMLGSCPELRTLHFGLVLQSLSRDPISPVSLPLLEVLCAHYIKYREVGALTPLIIPGPRLLQFSLEIHGDPEDIHGHDNDTLRLRNNNLLQFFAHSSITRLYVKMSYMRRSANRKDLNLIMDQILHSLSNLQELWLDKVDWAAHRDATTDSGLCSCSTGLNGPRLEALYVSRYISPNPLRQMIQRHPVKMLVVWGDTQDEVTGETSTSELELALAGLGSTIRVKHGSFSPIEDWS